MNYCSNFSSSTKFFWTALAHGDFPLNHHTAYSHILLCDFFNTVILHCIFVLSVNFHVCIFRLTSQIFKHISGWVSGMIFLYIHLRDASKYIYQVSYNLKINKYSTLFVILLFLKYSSFIVTYFL